MQFLRGQDVRRSPERRRQPVRVGQQNEIRTGKSWPRSAEGASSMSLASLIATGTKVWLDGVEPDEIRKNCSLGITGATSNPAIVSKIIGHGHFDDRISELIGKGLTDDQIAWELDDELVKSAQKVFLPAWERTK